MKFIVTKELGRLARWLRILGFDTVYFKEAKLAELILRALKDDRAIITRSKNITHLQKRTVMIKSEKVSGQLKECFDFLKLKVDTNKIFRRCTLCNFLLEEVKKEDIKEFVPLGVYKQQKVFRKCPQCNKIYWQGSHWEKAKEIIKHLD